MGKRLATWVVFLLGLAATAAWAAPPTFRTPVSPGGAVAGTQADFWYVTVVPGTEPTNTSITVTADLRPLGGPMRSPFADGFTVCGDDTTDLSFIFCGGPPINAVPGLYQVTLTARDALGRSSTVTAPFGVGAPPDADSDGLPDIWEARFFDTATSANPADDPDADGRSNLQEFQAGSHPRGTVVRYFAEGDDSTFFRTTLSVFNPGATQVRGLARMQASDGAQTSLVLPGEAYRSGFVDLTGFTPGNDFSLVIEADGPLVVDRTMVWGRDPASSYPTWVDLGYGSHTETAITSPSTAWYLAEGATHGAFDLFYLLQNPNDQPATATVRYLRPAPHPPIVRTYPLLPRSRRTIWVDTEDAALAATDVSASITADRSILVERSMYYSTLEQPFAAGHNGAGVTAPSTSWYLAEGATGFFDAYLLLANPQATAATVTVTFLRDGGVAPIVRTFTVDAESRRTIDIAAEDPALTSASMGVGLTSTQPIVVERAMWWPSGRWQEAHLVSAAAATSQRWAFAEGRVQQRGFPAADSGGVDSYFLVANPTDVDTTITVKLYWFATAEPLSGGFPLPAHSRLTISASDFIRSKRPDLQSVPSSNLSVVIESSGAGIVAERAMYGDYRGVIWASGTAALGTPLP
jgi:hypothetical protein